METKEFSDLLIKARENKGLSRYALGLRLNMPDAHLRRIELALNNYNIKKVFEYLSIIECGIHIAKNSKSTVLNSEKDFIEWVIKRRGDMTQYALAKLAGVSRLAVVNIEEGKTTARIDTFLKLIEALGYKIDQIC